MDRNWQFGVHVTGDSEAEVRNGISALDRFLRMGTPDDPVYLHVRGSEDVAFEPLWGQYGSDLRYEIIYGSAAASREYSFGIAREGELPECRVDTLIKPMALGKRQSLAFAKGGIVEDLVGSADGLSRGVVLGGGVTNKFNNPIFGNVTAYDTAWTTGSNLVKTKITDPDFVLFGKVAVKLAAAAATLNTFTATVAHDSGVSFLLTCYAKRLDSAAVTSADLQLTYNGVTQTTNYIEIGNGWYFLWARPTTPDASEHAAGVIVKVDRTIFVDGFQSLQSSDFSPLIHGDLLGCSWAGTAHNSDSTRTAAHLRVPASDALEVGEGTIRVVLRSHQPTDQWVGGYGYLFAADSSGFSAWHQNDTGGNLKFYDGTNTITATNIDWEIGEIVILHFVWASAKLKIYVNGSEAASGGQFSPPTGDSWLYIGSSSSALNQLWATIMDFTTFAQDMSQAEVEADYANILEHVEDDRRLAPVPWIWTSAGDGRVENCNDSASKNYCVIGAIPGSAPAASELRLKPITIWTGAENIWLSNAILDEFIEPIGNYFYDRQGTSDTTACGDEVETISVNTTEVYVDPPLVIDYRAIAGKDLYLLFRMADAGANLQARWGIYIGNASYLGEYVSIAADSTFRLFVLGPVPILDYRSMVAAYGSGVADNKMRLNLLLQRTVAGAANVSL
ncbi:MAG: hypothetical protein GTO41_25095, partial [Burkholderiales bacterium]|nr:hypothetical protein [Burkholderiales bacterium]